MSCSRRRSVPMRARACAQASRQGGMDARPEWALQQAVINPEPCTSFFQPGLTPRRWMVPRAKPGGQMCFLGTVASPSALRVL